jgi:hypothetical protein
VSPSGEVAIGEDMRIISLKAIILLGLCPAYSASGLTGVWTLNRSKSKFGRVTAPEQVVVRMERDGSRLATWRITSDPDGQHLVYREYELEGKRRALVTDSKPVSIVLPMESTGGKRINERWRVSKGRLIIHRSIAMGRQTIHQRLLLEPSTGVQGTNPVP